MNDQAPRGFASEQVPVSALLGPTNTGKTHQAVVRMLEHASGTIGLPLRLLAREVYDRVSAQVGEGAVALVTGEEKRVPPRPRYWVCTTESMPVEREVDFVAIDEVQLAAHRERGHVFTDRLLRARGIRETMFLGSDTMTAIIGALVPGTQVIRHPRFSRLKSAAPLDLSQLPPRSAVVAFSAAQVYEIAEKLRRRRGGAAVVLGALSPRTRNAQVAMYQAGEVQFMVATDAIGMGLNMDVDHVAFASLTKFDGRVSRPLEPAELAQIAGRAGRYTRDGTFGLLAGVPPLPHSVIQQIEGHRFAPVERVVWRSSELDFSSVDALTLSLRQRPTRPELRLVERADDADALAELATLPEVREAAQGSDMVALLWDVCRIPDFRKLLEGSHVRLLGGIFLQLARSGRIDPGWIERRIRGLDDTEGDIEALMSRIAHVRTWTYVSHHPRWIDDPEHWQGLTRAIEDRLSDALHDRLTQRFVDPRARTFTRPHEAKAGAGKKSRVERAPPPDSPFRQLLELRIEEEAASTGTDLEQVGAIVEAPYEAFTVDARGLVRMHDGPVDVVATLTRGADVLRPEVQVDLAEGFGAGALAQVRRRMQAWARDLVAELLGPLRAEAQRMSPAGRGLLYQLEHGLGSVLRARADAQVKALTADDRALCTKMGIQAGSLVVFAAGLLTDRALVQRAALWSALHGPNGEPPSAKRVSIAVDPDVDVSWYHAIGFPPFGPRAIRADQAERVFARLVQATAAGPTALPQELASWLGCGQAEVAEVATAMGLVAVDRERFALVRADRGRRSRRRGAR